MEEVLLPGQDGGGVDSVHGNFILIVERKYQSFIFSP